MQKLAKFIWLPLVAGFALTAPFFVMELVNRPPGITQIPYVLFITMWVTATLAVLTFRQVLRSGLHGPALTRQNAVAALRIVVLVVTATVWIGLVNDQMPCFMGVPNCD